VLKDPFIVFSLVCSPFPFGFGGGNRGWHVFAFPRDSMMRLGSGEETDHWHAFAFPRDSL
jgi:hypothetical protein